MNIRFPCPECETWGRLRVPDAGAPSSANPEWQCPRCDHVVRPAPATPALDKCPLCGNHELYRKKDFPHGLGMTILALACLASIPAVYYYQVWLTWAILLGSAAFDAVLYLLVGDVVECYRCHAEIRGVAPGPEHKPFELSVAERYRQEKLRREQLKPERS